MLGIEYAWNIYPSTRLSSGILLASNSLLLAGVWAGYPEGVYTSGLADISYLLSLAVHANIYIEWRWNKYNNLSTNGLWRY